MAKTVQQYLTSSKVSLLPPCCIIVDDFNLVMGKNRGLWQHRTLPDQLASLGKDNLLFWTDYCGTLPNVQNVVSVHAPDVRSTSDAVSISFCQGKHFKTKQIIGHVN